MRYVQAYRQELPVLRDLLPTIETSVNIISGKPKSKLDLIDAGHFIWEDAADRYASGRRSS